MPHLSPLPLALYIHIPWCVRKCPYCDFNSHRADAGGDEQAYVTALLDDLVWEVEQVSGRAVESIFIGGGTPSLFSGAAVERLLAGVRRLLTVAPGAEITLEANPGAQDSDRFAAYRQAGVNRLSIGAQSFDADCLRRLGRIHGPDEIGQAVAAARAAGFDNINLDLMFGLPGQVEASARSDVEAAIALKPEHISYYQLTLEPNTAFAASPPVLPAEEEIWAIQQVGQERLERAGYRQYEVSAYAREGRRCRHNLNYWRFGDYLGIGAGAHAKLSDPGRNRVVRRWRLRGPGSYMAAAGSGDAVAGERVLTPADLELEFMMNLLRLVDGFEISLFSRRTGLDPGPWLERVERAVADGLLTLGGDQIRPTARGGRFLDDLLLRFDVD